MNIRFRLLVSTPLYMFTTATLAHPGPHAHIGLPEGAWHAFIGWELVLAAFAAGGLWFVIQRLRNTRAE